MPLIDIQPIDPSVRTASLTDARIDGDGTFDVLMRAFKGHIDEEFGKNRIKGAEFAQVYLGGLQQVMQTALQLTLQQRSTTLDNELKEEQITLARIAQRKAEAEIELVQQQKTNLVDELLTSALQRDKTSQEITNLAAQKLLIEAQTAHTTKQMEMVTQQITNLQDDLLTSVEQRKKIIQETTNLAAQLPLITAQVAYQQKQGTLIDKQIEKMAAEILSEAATRDRIAQEILLMQAKVQTERAQTQDNMVGGSSVLGKQIALHEAQVQGFSADRLQKAASVVVDTWKIRRTTDEAVSGDGAALSDTVISAAVLAMLRQAGVPGV